MAATIDQIDCWVLRAPIAQPVANAFGSMNNRPAVFLQLTDSHGASGWGEVFSNFPQVGAEHRARLIKSLFAPLLKGMDAENPESVRNQLDQRTRLMAIQCAEPGPFAQITGAVDQALWDMAARRAGVPLWRLLGGKSDRVRVYASGIGPDKVVEVARAKHQEGYRAFKLKVGFDAQRDRSNLAAMRAALGEEAVIMCDANQAWSPSEAAQRIVSHGGYPGAVAYWPEPERWRAYLRDAIVEPAIGRDLMALEAVRKPALLRQVVALACGHPAEIWSLDKISGSLTDRGALETIAHYLDLLREACLVAPLPKYAGSTLRRRRAPPKLVVLDNALLVGAGDLQPPDPASDPTRWGRWVENACLAHAVKRGLAVTYWREEPWEADAVIDGARGRWVVEVKTGAYGPSDLRGLAQAAAALPTHRPLVLCDPGREEPARQAGFTAVAWTEFLFDRW